MKYNYSIPVLLLLVFSVMAAGCLSLNESTSVSEEQISWNDEYGANDIAYNTADESTVDSGISPVVMGGGDYESSDTVTERKVVKYVDLSLRVRNATTAAEALENIADSRGGYVSSSSVYNSYYSEGDVQKQGYVNLRIPADELEETLAEMKALGEVQSESSSAQDVTEEYIDLDARLSNLKKQETRLLEILDMSTTVEEILDVETELGRVRGDIESLQGRLNYLNSRIDMATVNVHLTEPAPLGGSLGIRNALSDAVQGFISTVRGIIVFVGYILPVVIVLCIAGVILILAVRRKRK